MLLGYSVTMTKRRAENHINFISLSKKYTMKPIRLNFFVIHPLFYLCIVSAVRFPNCFDNIPNGTLCQNDNLDVELSYPPKPLPIRIKPMIYLKDIAEVNEEWQTISLIMHVFVQWQDLRYSAKNQVWKKISVELSKKLWFPILDYNMMLENVRLNPNIYFWLISTNSTFEYMEEIQITIGCNFTFSSYPFDSHFCNLTFTTRDHIAESALLENTMLWYFAIFKNEEIIDSLDDLMVIETMTPFRFKIRQIEPFLWTYRGFTSSASGLSLELTRKSTVVLLNEFFIPTGTFAIVSMASFLIDRNNVPGRMGLIVTLLLISSNVYNNVQAPSSRGFSYIEVWILGSQVPILFALLEYALILFQMKYLRLDSDFRILDCIAVIVAAVYYFSFNLYFWGFDVKTE